MANINDLGLSNSPLVGGEKDLDYSNLPEPGGSFPPPLYPGTYKIRLPHNLNEVWDPVQTDEYGERLRASFRGEHACIVTQSPEGWFDNESFSFIISNVPRARGKDKLRISDMDYLLSALGEKSVPRTNAEYAHTLMKYAGQEVLVDVEWSARCNPERNIRQYDESGTPVEVEGMAGCGRKFYQRDIPKNEGIYMETFTCDLARQPCPEGPAILRCFANPAYFRPVR